MIKVYCLSIKENLETYQMDKLTKYLSKDKFERISKFYKFQDYRRALFADILARYMIFKTTKKEMTKIVFDYNKYGKPLLKGEPNVYFNMSHSGEWIVGVVHNSPIGIDIEEIRRVDFSIGKKFFTNKEYEYIMNKNQINRLEYFYELWTLKESYIKAVGDGLTIPLNSFNICINNNAISVETVNEFVNYNFKQYNIDFNYKMAICHTKKATKEEINIFGLRQFYREELSGIK